MIGNSCAASAAGARRAGLEALALVLVLLWPAAGRAGEWPGFLGPLRNGTLPGESLPDSWPPEGPARLWERPVGSGFSGPVALVDRVVLHHRIGGEEIVWSLDPATGRTQWSYSMPTDYRDDFGFDDGPRATPAAYRGRLYAHGAQGLLVCLDLQSGRPVWQVDTRRQLGASKGFFGPACSPLVEGDLVILGPGSAVHGGIVALDRATGALRWKASRDEASYSSPVAATIGGSRLAVFFDREGMKAVDLRGGALRFQWPWRPRARASVNAATPLVRGDQVFLTTSYGRGAILLDLSGPAPRQVWSGDSSLSAHYATPVRHGEHLYGFHGRQERGAALRCVSWQDGTVRWSRETVRNGSVLGAGDRLLILQENGELILIEADPAAYRELDRAQILPFGVRAFPALAEGVLYARGPKTLAAWRMR